MASIYSVRALFSLIHKSAKGQGLKGKQAEKALYGMSVPCGDWLERHFCQLGQMWLDGSYALMRAEIHLLSLFCVFIEWLMNRLNSDFLFTCQISFMWHYPLVPVSLLPINKFVDYLAINVVEKYTLNIAHLLFWRSII